jgi:hypothetical protein
MHRLAKHDARCETRWNVQLRSNAQCPASMLLFPG